jgi:hypothetical protein
MLDIATEAVGVKPESNTRGWKFFADEINKTWRKGAADFIRCGQLLNDAKAELQTDAFNAMVKTKLAFDRSVGAKLMGIADKPMLCAHAHNLPPSWTTLYELSQLKAEILQAKLADGTIHPGMERKDAIALRKPESKPPAKTPTDTSVSKLGTAWQAASKNQRRAFLDGLGRDGLCAAMSPELQADLRDHVVGITIAGASKSSIFAVYATDKLHCALRCAEQPEPDQETTKLMIAALGCIVKKASTKGIARSDIVIAQGKPTIRKK